MLVKENVKRKIFFMSVVPAARTTTAAPRSTRLQQNNEQEAEVFEDILQTPQGVFGRKIFVFIVAHHTKHQTYTCMHCTLFRLMCIM